MNGYVNEGDKSIQEDFQVSDHCIITVEYLVVELTETENRRMRNRFEVICEKMALNFWHDDCEFFEIFGGGVVKWTCPINISINLLHA